MRNLFRLSPIVLSNNNVFSQQINTFICFNCSSWLNSSFSDIFFFVMVPCPNYFLLMFPIPKLFSNVYNLHLLSQFENFWSILWELWDAFMFIILDTWYLWRTFQGHYSTPNSLKISALRFVREEHVFW